MKLYCMRHGEALPGAEDAQRPLSDKGREDVSNVATHLRRCRITIDHVMSSKRVRAVQTAETMAEAMGISEVTPCEHGLDEMDSVGEMVENIRQWHDDTLLVSHLPFLSKLVSALVLNDEFQPMINFAPGSIICLHQFEGQLWNVSWLLKPIVVPRCCAGDQDNKLF